MNTLNSCTTITYASTNGRVPRTATSTAMTAEQALEVLSDMDSPNRSDEKWEESEEDQENEEDAAVDDDDSSDDQAGSSTHSAQQQQVTQQQDP